MRRTTMFKEPLERYLLHKIMHAEGATGITKVTIRPLGTADRRGCNWDVETIEPIPEMEMICAVRSVIKEARAGINLATDDDGGRY
jgi:hypothetical protein